MRRCLILVWTLSFLTIMATGCDDESTTTRPDVTPDADDDSRVGDVVEDGTEETGGDPSIEPVEDVQDEEIVEIPGCVPSDCTDPQACVGGECVDPVTDLDGYADEAETRDSSYFWTLQLPQLFTPSETCCFDYTGDGNADDALGVLLSSLAPMLGGVDIQEQLDIAIETGQVTLLVDWRELPATTSEDVKFSVFLGTNDLNDDGVPDDTVVVREDGDGVYALEEASFGSHGSLVQFNLASRLVNTIIAGPSTFNLLLDLSSLGFGQLSVTLLNAKIVAEITEEDNGIHTVDQEIGSGNEAWTKGGGQLGGVVAAPELIQIFDGVLRGCTCAGVDPTETVLSWEMNREATQPTMDIFCCTGGAGGNVGRGACSVANAPDSGDACGDDMLCSNAGMVCGLIVVLGGILDVDHFSECADTTPLACTVGTDGINDSLSAGLRFGWTGATISTIAYSD